MPVSKFHDLLHRFEPPDPAFPGSRSVIDRMRRAPKFVFSDEVIEFLIEHNEEYSDALDSMAAANHFDLPHSPMLVEYGGMSYRGGGDHLRGYWLIEGGKAGAYKMWAALDLGRGESPLVPDGYFPCWLRSGRRMPLGDYTGGPIPEDWRETFITLQNMQTYAMFLAMTLHVRGIITRPPREENARLDRARAKRHLPPITRDYVTIHIGFITDKTGKRIAYTEGLGHHVRIHLRRGHYRNQAYGPKRQEHKEMWIPPVLVNYRPGVTVEEADYLVVP